jgi:hypothetical protein
MTLPISEENISRTVPQTVRSGLTRPKEKPDIRADTVTYCLSLAVIGANARHGGAHHHRVTAGRRFATKAPLC